MTDEIPPGQRVLKEREARKRANGAVDEHGPRGPEELIEALRECAEGMSADDAEELRDDVYDAMALLYQTDWALYAGAAGGSDEDV